VLFYAGLIFYLSSLHHPQVPRFPYSDKIYHAIIYCGFGFLFVRALNPSRDPTHFGWSQVRILEVAALGATVYGLTDEFHQIFVAGRSPEVGDLIADGIGGLLGGTLYLLTAYVERRLRKGKVPDCHQAMESPEAR